MPRDHEVELTDDRTSTRHTVGNLMLVLLALIFLGALVTYFVLARTG